MRLVPQAIKDGLGHPHQFALGGRVRSMHGRAHASTVDAGGSSTVGLFAATEGVLAFLVPHHKCDFQNCLGFFLHATKRLSSTTGGFA
jgi:hypothetical protein